LPSNDLFAGGPDFTYSGGIRSTARRGGAGTHIVHGEALTIVQASRALNPKLSADHNIAAFKSLHHNPACANIQLNEQT
jgi:hypothetical protein